MKIRYGINLQFKNVGFSFLMVLLFSCYHENSSKDVTLFMHVYMKECITNQFGKIILNLMNIVLLTSQNKQLQISCIL